MGEGIFSVTPPDYSDRRNAYFVFARAICLLGHRLLVRPHVEMHDDILTLKRGSNAVFLYCGLHRSLWETSGVMPPLYYANLPLPYVGMGDNLIKGDFFQTLSKKLGAFLIQRPTTRREMLESARRLRADVLSFLAHGLDVMVFPEGTRKNIPTHARYGDFFPAAFEAVLEYQRNKAAIAASTPGLKSCDAYVVPFNVDYTRVREAEEMVAQSGSKPRTLHVFDSLSMIRNIGDTYLSYGKPIPLADHLGLDRKGLAALCRQRCLELVKILPVNVASRAMLQLEPSSTVSATALHDAIRRVVERLRPYADRFRGFSPGDAQAEILRRARQVQLDFHQLLPENVGLYRLYANYIGHYLEASPAPGV